MEVEQEMEEGQTGSGTGSRRTSDRKWKKPLNHKNNQTLGRTGSGTGSEKKTTFQSYK